MVQGFREHHEGISLGHTSLRAEEIRIAIGTRIQGHVRGDAARTVRGAFVSPPPNSTLLFKQTSGDKVQGRCDNRVCSECIVKGPYIS